MFLLILLLICILCMTNYVQRWKRSKIMKLFYRYKPKSVCLPFIGNAHVFLADNTGKGRMSTLRAIGEESYEKGGLIAYWMGNKLYLGVSNPVAAEVILKNCLDKDDLVKVCQELTGNGSIFAPVQIWRPRRKILAPIFSVKNLNRFVKIFAEQSEVMVNRLKDVKNQTIPIWNYLTTYTMDAVCDTTLGIKVHAQLQPDLPFLRSFEELCQIGANRVCQLLLHSNIIFRSLPVYKRCCYHKKIVCDFITEIIELKKVSVDLESQDCTKPTEGLKTFLELIIESSDLSGKYGTLELQEETLVIVLAGTDTSAVGASFTALMLSMHPDVQDKCYEELQEVFGQSNRPVTAEDLHRLKYLEAVIKETLRLYPPVPFIIRQVEKDLNLPSGDTLAAGCGVIISIFAIHRNPQYWGEDADQFQPDRFLNSELTHPAAFIPFSHGPRACLGYQYAMMSMKTAVASLLRFYRLLPASSTSAKQEPMTLTFDIMMRDADNFKLQLETRT